MTAQRFFGFERLEIYHESLELAAEVYQLTTRFPADERYGLTSQLRRAATSISLNISEGSGRESKKNFAHFLVQARGSVYEVVAGCQLAARLGYLEQEDVRHTAENAQPICAKISALARNLRQRV